MTRNLPPLVHVRAPQKGPRASVPPPSIGAPPSDDLSARALPVDVARRELQSGQLPRDTEVLFTGLGDWTPAHEVPELWIAPSPPRTDDEAIEDDLGGPKSLPPSASAVPPANKRRSFGALTVVGALLGALGLLGIGAAAIYFVYFHYTPVATRHLPKKCMVAARVDFIDWAFFKPFTQKIIPAIEEATKPKPPIVATAPEGPSLKERMLANAGINLDRDVRELAVCVYQDTSPAVAGAPPDPLHGFRAVIALGGRLKRGAIPGIYEAIRTEGFASSFRLDGVGENAVIRVAPPFPGVIGQAEDGTILFAPTDEKLAEVRPGTTEDEAAENTGLLKKGALELSASHLVFATLGALPPSAVVDAPTLDALSRIQTGHIVFELGSAPRIELTVEQRTEGDAKASEAAVRRLLELAQLELSTASTDWAGEHAAVSSARLVRTDTRLDLRLDFPFGDIDRGATTFSDQLKDEKSPLRVSTLPTFLFTVGLGPPPPKPAASGSASSSASAPPSGSANPPELKPEDD